MHLKPLLAEAARLGQAEASRTPSSHPSGRRSTAARRELVNSNRRSLPKNHKEPRTDHPGSIFTTTPSVRRDRSIEIEGPSIALHIAIALHLITVQPINLLLMAARLPIHQAQQTRRQSFIQVTAIFRKRRCLQARIFSRHIHMQWKKTTDSYFQPCSTWTASENLSSWSSVTVGAGISSIPLILYQSHVAATASSWEQMS